MSEALTLLGGANQSVCDDVDAVTGSVGSARGFFGGMVSPLAREDVSLRWRPSVAPILRASIAFRYRQPVDDVIGDNPVEHGVDVRVDVLVSAWNEERHLDRCLSAVLAQDYPHDLLSVVFVDGGSSDGTVAVARARAATDPRLRVVSGRGRLSLPAALNLGIAMSSAELVAKIDCHGYPEHDFVRRAVNALSECDADVAVIGGRPEQQGETAWGRAVARARVSRFGTGGQCVRRHERP